MSVLTVILVQLATPMIGAIVAVVLVFLFIGVFVTTQYKRCPPNKILVKYGKVATGRKFECFHGGGTFVFPLVQDCAYLSLDSIHIELKLGNARSADGHRVDVQAYFIVAISTDPDTMETAAERLLGVPVEEIRTQALDIIRGQVRRILETIAAEDMDQDDEGFLGLIRDAAASELNKIGLDVLSMDVQEVTCGKTLTGAPG